jgi:hypothetical protein
MKLNWLIRGPRSKLLFDVVLFVTAGVFLNQMGDHMFQGELSCRQIQNSDVMVHFQFLEQ